MAELTDETRDRIRALARSVSEHRSAGGVLDNLPAEERRLLQAMTASQRQVFMQDLAQADAEAGQQRFRKQLGTWRPDGPEPGSGGMS